MTLEELRALQDREDLRDRHVIELRPDGFTLAHTDEERALADRGGPPLEECEVHRWATALDPARKAQGGGETGVFLLRRGDWETLDGSHGYVVEPLFANAAETTRR